MNQMSLFDAEGQKREGLDAVERHNRSWVEHMRKVAREICERRGYVTIDDLRSYADEHDMPPHHQNAWGAVFRGAEWVANGYTKSKLSSNHARRVCVWYYKKE